VGRREYGAAQLGKKRETEFPIYVREWEFRERDRERRDSA
jgi:hypothetical protein